MTPRILSITTAAFLLVGGLSAQPPRIVVQGTGAPQVFADVNAAIAAALPDDKLYFSGGTFIALTDVVIDKPLHLIGAGIHPDSTSVTAATTLTTATSNYNNIVITTSGSGSTFTGIIFVPNGDIHYGTSNTDDDPTDLLFERCRFLVTVDVAADGGGTSSTTFEECLFHGEVNGAYPCVATFSRCIHDAAINSFGALMVDHGVFLNCRAMNNCGGATFTNSICTAGDYPVYQSNNIIISNCLFSGTQIDGNGNGGVVTYTSLNVPAAGIFLNETDGNYQFTDDLHLAPGSVGIGGANDGTDIGVYGSSSPYKPGNVPYNPHFRAANIATATNTNGELPLNIRVAAQTN